MRKLEIPKKSGGTRTIYVPGPAEKHRLRAAGHLLAALVDKLPTADCLHGFRENRSPVTMAQCHVGFRFTLSMDLRDFFDSCTTEKITTATGNPMLAEAVTVDGAARQGLPSSPAAANLCGAPLDALILSSLPPGTVYTRYADDLVISGNDKAALLLARDAIPLAAKKCGFEVNPKKTRLQCQDYGNRIVCGIAVGVDGIAAPRSTRRQLRAAQHQHPGSNKTRGLAEWVALKAPQGAAIGKCRATWIADETRRIFGKP